LSDRWAESSTDKEVKQQMWRNVLLSGLLAKGDLEMVVLWKRKGEMTFVCDRVPGAKRVYLTGDFNQWDPKNRRMVKVKDGSFRAKMKLEPGQYQYKFVVDGSWICDPDAERQVANPYGTLNSVVNTAIINKKLGEEQVIVSTKERYGQKLRAQLDVWKEQTDSLLAKAAMLKDDARSEYNKEIEKLKTKHELARKKLTELGRTSEDAWDHLKEAIENICADIGQMTKAISTRIKNKNK
jgi:hypothetical protein